MQQSLAHHALSLLSLSRALFSSFSRYLFLHTHSLFSRCVFLCRAQSLARTKSHQKKTIKKNFALRPSLFAPSLLLCVSLSFLALFLRLSLRLSSSLSLWSLSFRRVLALPVPLDFSHSAHHTSTSLAHPQHLLYTSVHSLPPPHLSGYWCSLQHGHR